MYLNLASMSMSTGSASQVDRTTGRVMLGLFEKLAGFYTR